MSEAELLHEVMLAVSKTGVRVFRNNTAQGWAGQLVEREQSAAGLRVVLVHAHPLHAGLTVGSSDLIGWEPRCGRFVAIETKWGRGKLTPEQRNFLEQVNAAHGIGIEARSVEDVLRVLRL